MQETLYDIVERIENENDFMNQGNKQRGTTLEQETVIMTGTPKVLERQIKVS